MLLSVDGSAMYVRSSIGEMKYSTPALATVVAYVMITITNGHT